MKKIVLLLALLAVLDFAGLAQTTVHPAKKQTVRPVKSKKKPAVVTGRNARMRLQLRQIRQHKKPLQKVDSAQKKLDKELHKKDPNAPRDSVPGKISPSGKNLLR